MRTEPWRRMCSITLHGTRSVDRPLVSKIRESVMLVLSRKQNEQICIGDEITITVVRVKGNAIRLGIEAPSHVPILRRELVFELPLQTNSHGPPAIPAPAIPARVNSAEAHAERPARPSIDNASAMRTRCTGALRQGCYADATAPSSSQAAWSCSGAGSFADSDSAMS